MCYSLTLLEPDHIQRHYAADFPAHWEFTPTYYTNAFTYPEYPILSNKNIDEFKIMQWGLIPFWVKNINDAEKIRNQTMNARSETIFEKSSFRYPILKKRCLVPASGFFEWRYYLGRNYPYYIYLKHQEIFSIAGIYDHWYNKDTDQEIFTFSVITCDANPLMAKIHNKKKRMPVILPKNIEINWLNDDLSKDEIQQFLQSYPEEEMEAITISRLVSSKTHNRNVPEVIKSFEYPELPPL